MLVTVNKNTGMIIWRNLNITAARASNAYSPLFIFFSSEFILYRALHFFTKKEINRRDYFLINILISKFIRWVFWSWDFFSRFGKRRTTLLQLKTLTEPFIWCSSPVTVSLCCFSGLCWLLQDWRWLCHQAGSSTWLAYPRGSVSMR